MGKTAKLWPTEQSWQGMVWLLDKYAMLYNESHHTAIGEIDLCMVHNLCNADFIKSENINIRLSV